MIDYPSQEALKEEFTYNEETGSLVYKRSGSGRKVGKPAGFVNQDGYVYISVYKKRYLGHRLIWIYLHGSISNGLHIDHIDGNRSNNKINNLRLVTPKENRRNSSKLSSNKSGINGVHYRQSDKRWCAQIHIDGKGKHLGLFKSKEEALKVRKEAEKIYGFHNNHGKDLI